MCVSTEPAMPHTACLHALIACSQDPLDPHAGRRLKHLLLQAGAEQEPSVIMRRLLGDQALVQVRNVLGQPRTACMPVVMHLTAYMDLMAAGIWWLAAKLAS